MPEILSVPDDHLASIDAANVAFLGPGEFTFSGMAASTFFPNAKLHPHETFEGVTDALMRDPGLIGVLPVRNEVSGDVYPALAELRANGGFLVLDEASLAVRYVLAGRSGSVDNIDTVMSHAQALKQVAKFLSTIPNLRPDKIHAVESTARAAEMVRESKLGSWAAVCSPRAAKNLHIIAKNVQDNPKNATRFVIIQSYEKSRVPRLDRLIDRSWQRAKVAGLVTLSGEEYESVYEMLGFTRAYDVRPSSVIGNQNTDGTFTYFIEFRGDPHMLLEALDPDNELRPESMKFKLLGAYPVRDAVYDPDLEPDEDQKDASTSA